jgi:hypothetical protein
MIAAPYQMLPGQPAHGRPVQEIVQPAIGHRELIDTMPQRSAEPGAEWYCEAELRVTQDIGWYESTNRSAEYLFAHPVANFQLGG